MSLKRILYTLLFCIAALQASGQDAVRRAYIAKYKDIAIRQMTEYKIPASIILAQACLESGNGTSRLAVKGNNHFGIKCHKWNGKRIYHNDDRRGECFRKYATAEESFKDHSVFLSTGPRYNSLFSLKITDYKAWAYGLKAAGYATDRNYAKMLIDIIEKYRLYEYDTQHISKRDLRKMKRQERRMKKEEKRAAAEREAMERAGRAEAESTETEMATTDRPINEKPEKERPAMKKPVMAESAATEPVMAEKDVQPLEGSTIYKYSLDRQIYTTNNVPYIIATGEESYFKLAKEYNLFKAELLKFNDLTQEEPIEAGCIIFIGAKKKHAAAENYMVKEGETLYSISQKLGIKLKWLCKYNGMKRGDMPKAGTFLKTR